MRRWLEANPDDEFAKDVRAKLTSEPRAPRYAYTREYLGWGCVRSDAAVTRWRIRRIVNGCAVNVMSLSYSPQNYGELVEERTLHWLRITPTYTRKRLKHHPDFSSADRVGCMGTRLCAYGVSSSRL